MSETSTAVSTSSSWPGDVMPRVRVRQGDWGASGLRLRQVERLISERSSAREGCR